MLLSVSKLPTLELLKLGEVLNQIKSPNYRPGQSLTQLGLDKANEELSIIEAELDSRQPDIETVAIFDEIGNYSGFERVI